MGARVLGFKFIQELNDQDHRKHSPYTLQEGFLFKHNKLCSTKGQILKLLVKEVYGGGLDGHFGFNKTINMLKEHLFWPKMSGDVHEVKSKCLICLEANSQFH